MVGKCLRKLSRLRAAQAVSVCTPLRSSASSAVEALAKASFAVGATREVGRELLGEANPEAIRGARHPGGTCEGVNRKPFLLTARFRVPYIRASMMMVASQAW